MGQESQNAILTHSITENEESFFLKIAEDFPLLKTTMQGKQLIYFDSAATTQKPQIVIDTLTKFYCEQYGTVHRAIYELAIRATEAYYTARKSVQSLLNAKDVSEIIFTKGTTESINLVASSFGKAFIGKGDEIILSESEHHSNIVPWQILAEERGAHLKIIPLNDSGEIILESFNELLSERTRLVAVGHISNALGTRHPIERIIAMAHQTQAKVLIDGAQSAPHIPVDVQKLDADFYAFSGHKFYGPTGVGVLYGKRELLQAMPPYQGGGDMIDTVQFEKTTYAELPFKFEAGTPMFAEAIALGTAIEYVKRIGLERIENYELALLSYATKQLQNIENVRIIGTAKQKGAIISFVIDGAHALDIGTLLDLNGIAVRTGHHCAQPTMKRFNVPSTIRVSFAFYNTLAEIDAFVAILKRILKAGVFKK